MHDRPTVMALRAVAALLLAASGLVLFTAPPAQACSCAGEPLRVGIRASAAIFTGTVEDDRRGSWGTDRSAPARVLTFAVDRVWKGEVTRSTEVGTGNGGGDCGLSVEEGEEALVFATLDESGGLTANICTSLDAGVEDVERLLGPGEAPEAGLTSHPASRSLWGWPVLVAAGALLGLAGVTAYVVARARRRGVRA